MKDDLNMLSPAEKYNNKLHNHRNWLTTIYVYIQSQWMT